MARVRKVWFPTTKGEMIIGRYGGAVDSHYALFDASDEDGHEYKYVLVFAYATTKDTMDAMSAGNHIAFTFEGTRTSKKGREYKLIDVIEVTPDGGGAS